MTRDGKKFRVRFFSSWSSSYIEDNLYNVTLYCNNKLLSKYFKLNLNVNINDLLIFALLRYKSLIILSCFIHSYYIKSLNEMRSHGKNLRKHCYRHKGNLKKLVYLRKYSFRTKIMNEYYGSEIDNHIRILSVLNSEKELSNFNEKDKQIIKRLNILERGVINDYCKSLTDVKDYRSKYIESEYMKPCNSLGLFYNSYNYTKVRDDGIKDLNNILYDKDLYKQSLDHVIEDFNLDSYVKGLRPRDVYILLLAYTYKYQPCMIYVNHRRLSSVPIKDFDINQTEYKYENLDALELLKNWGCM